MPEGDRFINVPAERLLAELRAIGAAAENDLSAVNPSGIV
jgi:hypothetical protein